jgi:hypothetical protein
VEKVVDDGERAKKCAKASGQVGMERSGSSKKVGQYLRDKA